ncbi:hypothetical protein [Streptomyces murinus]|uniref:hypothetical protein n=1 Tax=Streptomyces murinus TaxID=33900 RepID=UPI0038014AD1
MADKETVRREDLIGLVERSELISILAQEVSAVRHSAESPSMATISLGAEMSPGERCVDYKFTLASKMKASDDTVVADINVAVVARFNVLGDEQMANEAVLSAFANEVASMAAYPYLRQYTYDLAARIGLPNFTLGLLKRPGGNQVAASLDVILGM